MKKDYRELSTDNHFTALATWYQTPLGELIAQQISNKLPALLGNHYGYHCLQIGLPEQRQWLETVPINHKIWQDPNPGPSTSLLATEDLSPLLDQSMDLIILPHSLDVVEDPDKVLDDVNRILIGHGRVVIIGFNPYSLWGFKKWTPRKSNSPWVGHWHSPLSMKSLLADHGFDVCQTTTFFYRPPCAKPQTLERCLFLETLGRIAWPYPGGIYITVAKKYSMRVTPIRQLWRFKNFVIGKSMVESEHHHAPRRIRSSEGG